MATPITLKKQDEVKNRIEQKKKNQHLLPLSKSINIHGQSDFPQHQQASPLVGQGPGSNFLAYREPRVDFTADEVGFANQYINFASNKYVNTGLQRRFNNKPNYNYQHHPLLYNNRNKPIRLSPQTVSDMPEDVATDDYIIEPDNIYSFSGDNNFLAAHYPCEIKIDGHTYLSVEHYYQACKLFSLAGSEYALQLRGVDNPLKAKTKAKNILTALKLDNSKIEEWKNMHGYFMYKHAMVHKYVQNVGLRKMLLATGNKILAHAYERDSLFACGMNSDQIKKWALDKQGSVLKYPIITRPDEVKYVPLTGQGKNLFGVVCMQVRKKIHEQMESNERRGLPADEITVENIIPDLNLHTSMSVLNLDNGTDKGSIDDTGNNVSPHVSFGIPKILKKGEVL